MDHRVKRYAEALRRGKHDRAAKSLCIAARRDKFAYMYRNDANEPAGGRALAGTWQCDLSDNALTWSAEVYDLFGLPRGSPIKRDDIVSMYTEESRAMLDRLRSAAIAEKGSFTCDAEIVRPNGEHRWLRLTADVVCRDGRPTHLYGLKMDISGEAGQPQRTSR
jgi:PAS domain-containing protein